MKSNMCAEAAEFREHQIGKKSITIFGCFYLKNDLGSNSIYLFSKFIHLLSAI